MDKTLETAEDAVAKMVGEAFSGETSLYEVSADVAKFEFDAEFQSKIVAMSVKDETFMRRASHLLSPNHFDNVGEASVVSIALDYYKKYQEIADRSVFINLIKEAAKSKRIQKDMASLVVDAFNATKEANISGREYVEEKIAEFARHQAVSNAILASVELINQKKFDKIEQEVKKAIEIGINEDGDAYDYFEMIEERTNKRLDDLSGVRPPKGITTGNMKLDELLYHKGWGKKELASIMGGAKTGKSIALVNFAKAASLKGHNVLLVTLELGTDIIADRLDASISDTEIRKIMDNIHKVKDSVKELKARAGKLQFHEFPSGTFSPNMLRRLIERYKSKGTVFDLVVVDYADIMAPNFRYNDPIENSKSVYVDLRAIAMEENIAMLTATQTNREGFKATVAKAEHVAEDFNKVRTVDLMISINITDEERARGEARLYFAASRNQESGFTVFVKQNTAKMKFIESIIRVE